MLQYSLLGGYLCTRFFAIYGLSHLTQLNGFWSWFSASTLCFHLWFGAPRQRWKERKFSCWLFVWHLWCFVFCVSSRLLLLSCQVIVFNFILSMENNVRDYLHPLNVAATAFCVSFQFWKKKHLNITLKFVSIDLISYSNVS